MTVIKASRIGVIANEILSAGGAGRVIGVTSKGAFLRSSDQILFVTSANYCSPFNVTTAAGGDLPQTLQPGDEFRFIDKSINFPGVNLTIDTGTAEIWLPSASAIIRSTLEEQKQIASDLIDQLRGIDPGKGYLFLANTRAVRGSVLEQNTSMAARGVIEGYRKQDLGEFLTYSSRLLGSGSGLTPSGDDFLTGFILYHIRYCQSSAITVENLQKWNAELTELAFQKTTTISANRLQAAGRGWSEDVFLNLIDHLFDSTVPLMPGFVNILMNFGHSSGVDTFMGIYYALDSLIPQS